MPKCKHFSFVFLRSSPNKYSHPLIFWGKHAYNADVQGVSAMRGAGFIRHIAPSWPPHIKYAPLCRMSTKTARLFRLCLPIQYDNKTTVYCFSLWREKVSSRIRKSQSGYAYLEMRGICDGDEGDQKQPPHAFKPFIYRRSRRFLPPKWGG